MNQSLIDNLTANGFEVFSYETKEQVITKVNELIPEGAEVMTMTSVTLDTLGISQKINEPGKYAAIRSKLYAGDPEAKLKASSPEFAIGSVNAVTEDGKLVFASASGSQIPAYVYGGKTVIFVIGIQKIVPNLDAAIKRIEETVFPLEDERAKKAYGKGSSINKLLVLNKEPVPGRIKLLFINQNLGF